MPSYDVVNGQVIGAPDSVKKAWADFQGDKAPMSSAADYRKQAGADPTWKTDALKSKFKG